MGKPEKQTKDCFVLGYDKFQHNELADNVMFWNVSLFSKEMVQNRGM